MDTRRVTGPPDEDRYGWEVIPDTERRIPMLTITLDGEPKISMQMPDDIGEDYDWAEYLSDVLIYLHRSAWEEGWKTAQIQSRTA